MIPTPMQTVGSKRRKVSIEIYFVLYLSAIVLLLGTTMKSKHEDPDALIQTLREFMVDFNVNVEKVALVYTMLPAGLDVLPASEQLRRDSVNIIKAWGSVSDVRFEIAAIRDTLSGQLLPVENASLQNEGPFEAVVKWRPHGPMQNRVYSITVAASAEPEVPSTVPASSRARVAAALRSEGRVHDTVTFTVTVFAVTNPDQIHAVAARQQQIVDSAAVSASMLAIAPRTGWDYAYANIPFSADALQDQVTASPGRQWQNAIQFAGISDATTDIDSLSVQPSTAREISRKGGSITISGDAAEGQQRVTVWARRRDKSTASATFLVITGRLPAPKISPQIFAGEQYTLDFNAPKVDPASIRIRVHENGKLVQEGGAVISYTPRLTGSVTFERLVDGRVADEYSATILALPYPSFVDWDSRGDEAIITTKSHGTHLGRVNKAVLHVLDGNASDDAEEIDYEYDAVTKTHLQTWRIARQNPEREFVVVVWAWDQRGSAFSTPKKRLDFD